MTLLDMGLVLVQLHTLATHAGKIPEWNASVKFGEKAPLSARSPRRKKKKDPRALRRLRYSSDCCLVSLASHA